MARVDADRNLLLGILAQQMEFVTRDALFAAMNAWIIRKDMSLGALLVERGDLAQSRRDLLEALVDEHVNAHGADPARSLQALTASGPLTKDLTRIEDPDLKASVSYLYVPETVAPSTDPNDTRAFDPMIEPTPWNGRFRVVRPHASGGLGVVSVAVDDELDREVAFKEIKDRYADDRGSRARFVLEAEITGKLEHPGIIPIYGLGHDPTGRPFYAMRFIRGDSLADAINRFHDPNGPYIDPTKRALQLRELLGRFLDVCDAMAYAHSRGVLHRDLKPGNVMLGPFGETLVVDWGLALPLDRVPLGLVSVQGAVKSTKADTASLHREHGTAVGTPSYMSPEQAEGAIHRLGPESDVYGLGAILYDLLTGKQPVEGTSLEELLRRVGQGQIKPPRQVRSEVPVALEAICLKALALRIEDRYATPRGLAADIKAWLADEPVSARREPFGERARRWAKRHRTAVTAAAAAVLVGLVGLAAVAAVQTRARNDLGRKNRELIVANAQVERARQRAEEGHRQAREAVDTYFTKVSQSRLLNVPGLQPLRKELLDSALGYYRGFLRDSGKDPKLAREAARAQYRVGRIIGQIGSDAEALENLNQARDSVMALARQAPDDLGLVLDLADVENSIGSLQEGRYEVRAAMDSYARCATLHERVVAGPSPRAIDRSRLAFALVNLGRMKGRNGLPDEELADTRRAILLAEGAIRDDPGEKNLHDLASTQGNLIGLSFRRGNLAEALAASDRAREIYEALHRDHPEDVDYSNELAVTLDLRSFVLRMSGRTAEALAASEASQELFQGLVEANPRVVVYRSRLAMSYNMAGDLARQLGRFDALGDFAGKARDLLEVLQKADPKSTAFIDALSKASNNLGRYQAAKGLRAEALASFLRNIELSDSLPSRDPVGEYNLACNLALALSVVGDPVHPTPAEVIQRDKLAERALGALRKAIAGGMTSLELYREDDDLNPLRDRDGFRLLLLDLAFPTRPFAK